MASQVHIGRLNMIDADAVEIIHEYYEAVNVVVRDPDSKLSSFVEDERSGFWVAFLDGRLVGCVILRPLPEIDGASECKRRYVRPDARGNKVADRLLDEMEAFARDVGYEWIYLDTYGDLKAAISIYTRRGYEPCERYNDNPQATVFMRKPL